MPDTFFNKLLDSNKNNITVIRAYNLDAPLKSGNVVADLSKVIPNDRLLVENLNFTYQLKNGMFPVNRKEENIIRLLKEVIISILNHPKIY